MSKKGKQAAVDDVDENETPPEALVEVEKPRRRKKSRSQSKQRSDELVCSLVTANSPTLERTAVTRGFCVPLRKHQDPGDPDSPCKYSALALCINVDPDRFWEEYPQNPALKDWTSGEALPFESPAKSGPCVWTVGGTEACCIPSKESSNGEHLWVFPPMPRGPPIVAFCWADSYAQCERITNDFVDSQPWIASGVNAVCVRTRLSEGVQLLSANPQMCSVEDCDGTPRVFGG